MSESTLQRLLELSASLPNASLRKEQRELVQNLAQELKVTLDASAINDTPTLKAHQDAAPEEPNKKVHHEDSRTSVAPSSAREKFQKQEQQQQHQLQQQQQQQQNTITRKEARKSMPARTSSPATGNGSSPTGNSDCDIASAEIKTAYDQVRDDNSTLNWLSLGYGASKKTLELYGSGEGSLKEFTSKLKDDEITYGYVRVIYGDSQRSKFVFITYVPEGLSILTKARANTHKPAVTAYLKYMHSDVYATSTAELDEAVIQAKLAAAAGANYGTGGTAAAGSEDFGSIKDNAKNFFQQTEGKGNRQSIVYHKGPLSDTTPVALQGRAGITEKYIKV